MHHQEQCHKSHGLWHKAAAVSLIVLGGLLIADHWNHVVSALPYLLLLLCPLMHLFMHHGHSGHGEQHASHQKDESNSG